MSSYISCYNEKKELEHFEVPDSVYFYVRQLENEIKYSTGGVKELYNFRFGVKNESFYRKPRRNYYPGCKDVSSGKYE